ncbi:MAG: FKBP-type peptidyl-prolyl cis-trans isomerase [Chitinophagaceae bacterium]|nr:FKBP-type peptidyl-prolyl cis-trans isomerase [Chitinophagaceae bacterium]
MAFTNFKTQLFVLLLSGLLIQIGCKKKENCDAVTIQAPESEITTLRNHLTTYGITATEDYRGFFYVIINPGGSDKPSVCDDVKVNYVGRFLNGTVFDQANGASFGLQKLIVGWQEGIPLIGAGGKIRLYLPPTLAYGSSGSGSIPANSNLIFDIDLLGF